jgi:hypothetical protein
MIGTAWTRRCIVVLAVLCPGVLSGCGFGLDAALSAVGAVFDDGKYVFEPNDLIEIAKMGIGLPHDQMFKVIHDELLKRYPGHIAETESWHFNVAGGAMGQLTILHASPKEYLIFFGTPIGTEGHSGRYDMDVWDIMIDGEMWAYHEGDVDRRVYLPGDAAFLERGQTKGYRIPDHGWMLEYSRGNIPAAFGFGVIASTANVTHDWQAAWGQITDFAGLAIKELLQPD